MESTQYLLSALTRISLKAHPLLACTHSFLLLLLLSGSLLLVLLSGSLLLVLLSGSLAVKSESLCGLGLRVLPQVLGVLVLLGVGGAIALVSMDIAVRAR